MATLLEKLPLPDKREQIVDDCCRLLDGEVRKKGGMSGLAVKAGYKVLKSIKPGAVCEAIVQWAEADIHHLEEHQHGGQTVLPNGLLVHRHCHPKGAAAAEFARQYQGP